MGLKQKNNEKNKKKRKENTYMLECLEKIKASGSESGIMLLITEEIIYEENGMYDKVDFLYCAISFGAGNNSDNRSIAVSMYRFDGSSFEEIDGGDLDYDEAKAKYGDDIRNAVPDALRFMFGKVPAFIPLHMIE